MKKLIEEIKSKVRQDGLYYNKDGLVTVSVWSVIKYSREVLGMDLQIHTDAMYYDDFVMVKAKVIYKDKVLGTGHNSNFKRSVAAAETFAIHRALMFGLGLQEQDLTCYEEHRFLDLPVEPADNKESSVQKDDMDDPLPTEEAKQLPTEMEVDPEEIKESFKTAIHLPRLKYLRESVYADQIDYLLKKSLRDYRQVTDIYESRKHQLENESNFTSSHAHNI